MYASPFELSFYPKIKFRGKEVPEKIVKTYCVLELSWSVCSHISMHDWLFPLPVLVKRWFTPSQDDVTVALSYLHWNNDEDHRRKLVACFTHSQDFLLKWRIQMNLDFEKVWTHCLTQVSVLDSYPFSSMPSTWPSSSAVTPETKNTFDVAV